MNKSYEFEEDALEEGITFKKIVHFFKKGWLRAIVYVAICLLVAMVVALPIKTFYKSEPTAQTTVEYVYDGIEDGLAPDGSIFLADNLITAKILSEAVEDAKLGGKITDISALRQNMRVEGVQTAEYVALVESAASGDEEAIAALRSYVMHPTSFNIILSNPAKLGLTDSDAKKLLNSVVNCYYSDFATRFSVQNMFQGDMFSLSVNQSIEFTDILDIYDTAIEAMRVTLVDMAEKNPDFVSRASDTSFAKLASMVVVLENRYELLSSYIAANNIWLDKIAARHALTERQNDIDNKITAQESFITSLKAQIEMINREYELSVDSDKQQVVIGKYPEVYNECHRSLIEANKVLSEYQVQMKDIEAQLNKIGDANSQTDVALVTAAKKRLYDIEKDTVALVEQVNMTIDDYYTTRYLSAAVRQTRQPIVVRLGLSFSVIMVFAAAGALGLLAAIIVTAVKISKANSARRKAAEASVGESDSAAADENK